jgi:hypothetical protein
LHFIIPHFCRHKATAFFLGSKKAVFCTSIVDQSIKHLLSFFYTDTFFPVYSKKSDGGQVQFRFFLHLHFEKLFNKSYQREIQLETESSSPFLCNKNDAFCTTILFFSYFAQKTGSFETNQTKHIVKKRQKYAITDFRNATK